MSKEIKVSDVYKAYLNGDSITDADLIKAYKRFKEAAILLSQLGERFALACKEARHVEDAFRGFISARGISHKLEG